MTEKTEKTELVPVRLNTALSGVGDSKRPGQIHRAPKDEADRLVAAGIADFPDEEAHAKFVEANQELVAKQREKDAADAAKKQAALDDAQAARLEADADHLDVISDLDSTPEEREEALQRATEASQAHAELAHGDGWEDSSEPDSLAERNEKLRQVYGEEGLKNVLAAEAAAKKAEKAERKPSEKTTATE